MGLERRSEAKADRDGADAALLVFEVDDAAIEIAATGAGTIPTASVNLVPPNCCTQDPLPSSR
jgi:hypothetical protein